VKVVKPARTIAVGFSIGTGVAAQLALTRPVDGLLLVTPFDSLKEVAQAMFPWLPIGPFFEHEIDAAAALEESSVPVAILQAERDEVVPGARTQALRKRVGNLVYDRTIKRAGHNDIYARSDFHAAAREALNCLETRHPTPC
jgi:pimeloyl-ACP methyl ester carboxylesterase